ncbi:MAG TPA: bacteriohemerythrin [Candidatus Flavonifractor merdigallinarum]|uniref:Bacteriohemerythrin n=1 Tax=Candidatus Flavonifractor merdigallinarum TaxID=2838589 RepID=A0A9D1YB73_9FIRM|nr:bacteriohemerythrin [Candidatus Flavonifractor merdigallinarum]
MMWKDSYRLGVERIDQQHMELFRMTEDLVNAVKEGASVEVYQKALGFLKEYVIYHFRDEEAYQASIQYSGLEAHKEEHRQFTQTVVNYEKRLTECGFDEKTMKDLAGTVTAWLIYHVVDTDQKIVTGETAAGEENHFEHYVDLFTHSTLDVLESMAGLDRTSVQMHTINPYQPEGDLVVQIQLVGDLSGEVVFGYSKELALHLLQTMTGMELTELDELVQSALCELANISCGNAATALTRRGLKCDIKPPVIDEHVHREESGSGIRVETASGCLGIGVLM